MLQFSRSRMLLLGAALGLALGGCNSHHDRQPAGAAAQASVQQPAPAVLRRFIDGADQAAIRSYLDSVHPVVPRKFDVTWSADTIPVSRDEAIRALRRVSRDGNTYVFSSAEPVVKRLQPGKIVWIWGIDIRRIVRVGVIDDATIVHTKPLPLSEAMSHADIEFATPLDLTSAYGVMRGAEPDLRTVARTRTSPLRPVLLNEPPAPAPGGQSPDSPNGEPSGDVPAEDVVAGTSDGFTGSVAGFQYSVGYRVNGEQLSFDLQARKAEDTSPGGPESNEMHRDQRKEYFEYLHEQREAEHEADEAYAREERYATEMSEIMAFEAGQPVVDSSKLSGLSKASLDTLEKLDEIEKEKAKKTYEDAEAHAQAAEEKARNLAMAGAIAVQVFYILSDNLDVRFRSHLDLGTPSVAASIVLNNGVNTGTTIDFQKLAGQLDLEMVARMGEAGTGTVSIPVAHVPVAFNIPLIIEGVPFIVQIAGDFLFKVGLSGKHAVHHFHAHFKFGGGAGFNVTAASQTDTHFALAGEEPEVESIEAESPGVSGSVLAVQIPRLGLGIGAWGLGLMGYIDHVVVLTVTNGAGVALLNPACKRLTVDRVAHVGADLSTLMPIPVVQTLLPALGWKKDVWHAEQWKQVIPDIAMCHVGG